MKMIITSECEECQNGIVEDADPRRIMVYCAKKDKTYFFGQCIPCDDFIDKNRQKG